MKKIISIILVLASLMSTGCMSYDIGRMLPVKDISQIPQGRSAPALFVNWEDPLIWIGGAMMLAEADMSDDLRKALANSGYFSIVKNGRSQEGLSLRITSSRRYVEDWIVPKILISSISLGIIPVTVPGKVHINVSIYKNGAYVKGLSYSEECRMSLSLLGVLFGKSVNEISEALATKVVTSLLVDIHSMGLLNQADVSL